ncbi:uncharacterized protein B0H64DRAFT_439304 [Chaetomium fimeti]|uniref:Uncharacterized protein n=1 Tax=Chaetomium fimeti TaxID=1854472 RepID=A0AAE0HLY0_9PEZI|nr:hypothetical protein B0H64DRAFT_439304 [Chaetomium fimeti]
MCLITHYRDFHCGHRWATVTQPCYPGMGFDACPKFTDGKARPLPPRLVAQGEPCPKCDLGNVYDRNVVRVVTKVRYGFRWGLGPDAADPGCDVACCVM